MVPLEEELTLVRAYLDIESLRLGNRLKIKESLDPGLAGILVPPFSLQPLVENAVQHGVQSSPKSGQLHLVVRSIDQWLEMSVNDDGRGILSSEIEQVFFAVGPRAHALSLLRRRLQGLFGRSFQLEAQSEAGQGTTVTLRIPIQKSLPETEVLRVLSTT